MCLCYCSLSGVIGIENEIYMTGGSDAEEKTNKKVFVYNTLSGKWKPVCDMNEARRKHGMVLTEKIYVMGGINSGNNVSTYIV